MNKGYEPAQLLEIRRRAQEGTDEPVLIGSKDALDAKLDEFVTLLPRVTPFYAVKCNPNLQLLQMLAARGLSFDCASKGEMQLILSLGVSPDRIIFANPCKLTAALEFARENGIVLMTFDNVSEMEKIASVYPEAQLVLRIATDDSHSVCRLSSKFGARSDMWETLIARGRSLDLSLVGVSFHVGSNCKCIGTYTSAIEDARRVFDIASDYGYSMNILDIGGGFPGVCGNPEVPVGATVEKEEEAIESSSITTVVHDPSSVSDESSGIVIDVDCDFAAPSVADDSASFTDIAATVNAALALHFAEDEGVKVIAEPGRFIATSVFTLLTRVIALRDKSTLYINDGVYGCFNCKFFDHLHPIPTPLAQYIRKHVQEIDEHDHTVFQEDMIPCRVFGPTCDSLDLVCDGTLLPPLEVGDYIVFENMGAYTVAAATAFNGFPVVEVIFV